MTGWQWFWTLVGFLLLILVLIFLYFFQPFEDLFTLVLNGVSYNNAIFWVALIIGIIGFCTFHWHAYKVHIFQQGSVESMVLTSLRGSTFTAILLSGGATLQSVQNLWVFLLQNSYGFDSNFGKRIAAIMALVVITGVFCVIFWLLKLMRPTHAPLMSGRV